MISIHRPVLRHRPQERQKDIQSQEHQVDHQVFIAQHQPVSEEITEQSQCRYQHTEQKHISSPLFETKVDVGLAYLIFMEEDEESQVGHYYEGPGDGVEQHTCLPSS